MDFLLECIGFPPDQDLAELVEVARRSGDSVPWRGPLGEHLRLPLGSGLELRIDREDGSPHWSVTPFFAASQRVRLAIASLVHPEDSPCDVLVSGWANPPSRSQPEGPAGERYPLSALLTDARRLPRALAPGHVLAVALAGFALDVTHVGERPAGQRRIAPLGSPEEPGGCVEVSLRVASLREIANPLTNRAVQVLEVETPGRALPFFLSPWQLEVDGLARPRPGWHVEGAFQLCGRIAGGLAGPSSKLGRAFG